MTDWWIEPELPIGHSVVFAVFLALSVGFQALISPRRRAYLGTVRFVLAAALVFGIPEFGVIVVRAGFRHAFLDAGRGWWTALWLSLFWMVLFVFAARVAAQVVPPFSGLMRAWRRAQVEGMKRLFGFGGPDAPRGEGMRVMRPVGRSKA